MYVLFFYNCMLEPFFGAIFNEKYDAENLKICILYNFKIINTTTYDKKNKKQTILLKTVI